VKEHEVDDKNVRLQLWDTPGQDRFKTTTRSYYRRGDLVLIAYDCGSKRSFDSLNNWITEVENHGKEKCKIIIVATKCDLEPIYR